MRSDLKHLVKFKPEELAEAIEACSRRAGELEHERQRVLLLAQTYSQLLRLHGEDDPPVARVIPPNRIGRFRGKKIADAAATVLLEARGPVHAQKIREALSAGGLSIAGKYPMNTLVNALQRDARIQRDPSQKNTWRMVAGADQLALAT